MAKTLGGVIGLGCFLFEQDGSIEDEFKRSVEAIVTELDLRVDDWASVELKSVAAQSYLPRIVSLLHGESVESPTSQSECWLGSWQRFAHAV